MLSNTGMKAARPDGSAQGKKDDPFTECINEAVVVVALGFVEYWRQLKRHWIIGPALTAGVAALVYLAVQRGWYFEALRTADPVTFSTKPGRWFLHLSDTFHLSFLGGGVAAIVLIALGIKQRHRRTKYQKVFYTVGLTNGLGDTPVLLKKKRDAGRTHLTFDTRGIGLGEFQAKKERLEAAFGCFVESMRPGGKQGRVTLVLSEKSLPERVSYVDMLAEKPLPAESFFAGMGPEGPITQKIAELPHLLIAGATGAGKSVFFKQALLGLLESSRHLQMYLIDLKGGLEMVDFGGAPNVAIVKDLAAAVRLLESLKAEMEDRFAFLEQNGLKQIVPARDKRDRIIVAVDEASVLYMNRPRTDPDYHAAIKARTQTDTLAKLARAASINLLIATQKLDRTVIPTSISENVSGRMGFKANSLQGSMLVLGHKGAMELPEIPGRGIWHFGTANIVVQAPYVSPEEIKDRCAAVALEFENEQRKTYAPLVTTQRVTADTKNETIITNLRREGA